VFIGLCDTKDGVFVAVIGNGATVFEQVAFQGVEIAEGALGGDETQFHQRAGRVVNEDEKGSRITAIFEPSLVRPVDLY